MNAPLPEGRPPQRLNWPKIQNWLGVLRHLPSTLLFNLRYFGWKGFQLPVLFASPVELRTLGGKVELQDFGFGMVRFGWGKVGLISRREEIVWENSGTIRFAGRAFFGRAVKISVAGILEFGDGFQERGRSGIIACDQVIFGKNVLLSWDVQVMDSDFHVISDASGKEGPKTAPIHIGSGVWMGCGSLALKGSWIPDGAIVAARTLVNRRFEGVGLLLAGVPARTKQQNLTWRP